MSVGTTCVPGFPSVPLPSRRRKPFLVDSSSNDESISSAEPSSSIVERVANQYRKMASLPFELAPASRSGSPSSSSRALEIHGKIEEAMEVANYSPSNPKWTHVSRMVWMAASSRRAGAAPGVRVGEKTKVDAGDYVFVIPDTEAEWEECERKWAARNVAARLGGDGDGKSKGEGKEKERRSSDMHDPKTTSKYWSSSTAKSFIARPSSVGVLVEQDRKETKESKEDRVTSRVRSWQAEVVRAARSDPALETPVEVSMTDARADEEQGLFSKPKRQSPLEFPAVKRGSRSAADKGGQGSSLSKPNDDGLPVDIVMASPERPKTPPAPAKAPLLALHKSSPVGIADVSEASFLPPSFPSYLETSTPKDAAQAKKADKGERHQPAAIHPRPFFSSSPPSPPLSNQSPFNPFRPRRAPQPLGMSSSLPIMSPTAHVQASKESRPLKRTRPLTPPEDDVFSGVTKKQRTGAQQDGARLESSAPLPPSSPPPVITPPLSKSTSPPRPDPLARTASELGNANGLPVLVTPQRQELPTLTDLLASSRRSKPRPRPPSRKVKAGLAADNASSHRTSDERDEEALPMLPEAEAVPDVSPAKTYFSSPASGSSQSTPQHLRQPPRSPVSPLFGAGSSDIRFSPPFTSTQHHPPGTPLQGRNIFKRGVSGGGGDSQPNRFGLARGSSGFFGMYNSQFDVEGQVGQVSELLERDVDFNEYLRDVDEVEEQGQRQDSSQLETAEPMASED